jgi:hypothetical protein
MPQSSLMPVASWSDSSIRWAWVEILADLSNNHRLELVTKPEPPQIPSLPSLQLVALAKPTNEHLHFRVQNSETQKKLPLLHASMEISGAWGTTPILLDDPSNWSTHQNELGIAFETLKIFKSETLPLPIRHFWDCLDDETALMTFRGWYGWATRSQLKPIIKVAKMLKRHLNGLMNYIEHRITNAVSEGFNSRIQSIKSAARGFRNFDNYRIRILFFCGKLDLSLKTLRH